MDTKLHTLPVAERIRIVEDLWECIAADQNTVPLTLEQKTELDRRLDAYAVEGNPGRLVADVVRTIRRTLGFRRCASDPTQSGT